MSDSRDTSPTEVNNAAIIFPIAAMVLILSLIPPAILTVWLRIVHPEFFHRNVPRREGVLPTTEVPSRNEWIHDNPIIRWARAVVSKFREVAIAARKTMALRSREMFEGIRGRMAGLFNDRGRRWCSDLPIMRQKSWQLLAESHTELTLPRSKVDDEVEHDTVEVVETPKASKKTVRFDLGDGDNSEQPCVRKPEPAMVAGEEKAADETTNRAAGRLVIQCSFPRPDSLVVVGTTSDLLGVRKPGHIRDGRNTIG